MYHKNYSHVYFFLFLFLSCLVSLSSAHPHHSSLCKYVLTNRTRMSVKKTLSRHVSQVASLPNLRRGSAPIILLHPPGTCVQGTVVIFHGFADNAQMNRLQARYLYKHGFNVYAVNLAGFAQRPNNWVRARLRNEKAYRAARSSLLSSEKIVRAVELVSGPNGGNSTFVTEQFGGPIMPVVRNILSRNAALRKALRGISALVPPNNFNAPGHVQTVNKYFISDFSRYQAEPLARVSEVQLLPGPLFTLSFSFGGPISLNAIASSGGSVKRAVMLAPFFPPENDDPLMFQWVAGALGLFERFVLGPRTVPLSPITASYIASAMSIRDVNTRQAKASTQVLCVIAEDDVVINVDKSVQVCNSKLGGDTLLYPKEFGLVHAIPPEYGNPYSDALLQQIVRYFRTGTFSKKLFLMRNIE